MSAEKMASLTYGFEQGWSYSPYRATLKKDGQFFAIVTPDGRRALSAEKEKLLLEALNKTADP